MSGTSPRTRVLHELGQGGGRAPGRVGWPPRWVRLSLLAFCLAELGLVGYARATSALAHARAAQGIVPTTAGSAAAVCTEADAALADSWPALPLLNAARLVPIGSVRAWGQLPQLADAVRLACDAVEVYARVAPWPDASIDDGAAADLLVDVRQQRAQFALAAQQLAQSWTLLETIDRAAMAAEPRLERPTRWMSLAKAQEADVLDALAVAAPERLETLLGGSGPRALVLASADRESDAQAFAVIQEGRIVDVEVGRPAVPPVAVITLDEAGLATMGAALSGAPRANASAGFGLVARATLQEMARARLAVNVRAAAALRQTADEHHAWLWFADPALYALADRRGWVRQ